MLVGQPTMLPLQRAQVRVDKWQKVKTKGDLESSNDVLKGHFEIKSAASYFSSCTSNLKYEGRNYFRTIKINNLDNKTRLQSIDSELK